MSGTLRTLFVLAAALAVPLILRAADISTTGPVLGVLVVIAAGLAFGMSSRWTAKDHTDLQPAAAPLQMQRAPTGTTPATPPPVELMPMSHAHIELMLRSGQKLNAIKQVREQMGHGLKEAKDTVDRIEAEMRARGDLK